MSTAAPLIAAGISLAIIAIVNGLGTKLNTKFTSINNSLKEPAGREPGLLVRIINPPALLGQALTGGFRTDVGLKCERGGPLVRISRRGYIVHWRTFRKDRLVP
jgi:hypothetical protein